MKTVNTEMNVETVTEVIEVDLVAKEEIVDLVVVIVMNVEDLSLVSVHSLLVHLSSFLLNLLSLLTLLVCHLMLMKMTWPTCSPI
jgi:hypothetical protein